MCKYAAKWNGGGIAPMNCSYLKKTAFGQTLPCNMPFWRAVLVPGLAWARCANSNSCIHSPPSLSLCSSAYPSRLGTSTHCAKSAERPWSLYCLWRLLGGFCSAHTGWDLGPCWGTKEKETSWNTLQDPGLSLSVSFTLQRRNYYQRLLSGRQQWPLLHLHRICFRLHVHVPTLPWNSAHVE